MRPTQLSIRPAARLTVIGLVALLAACSKGNTARDTTDAAASSGGAGGMAGSTGASTGAAPGGMTGATATDSSASRRDSAVGDANERGSNSAPATPRRP
jgi:hypothetical protein